MLETIATVDLRFEQDVVHARQRAREVAALLGFDHAQQIRLATATSEIARNAFRYAVGGKVSFAVTPNAPQQFMVEVSDKGHGIPHLKEVLTGRYKSTTGMGMGLAGTKRLMDTFNIDSDLKGTIVRFGKLLPGHSPFLTSSQLRSVMRTIAARAPGNPFEEIQQQNIELMKTLSELNERQRELARLNQELEDTNRGVVALYAELEDRADYLRRTSELKTTFLSNMSHEFRTPLNSILSLTRILSDEADGPLLPEQAKQVGFVQRSARELLDLVNDLLDLAKIEAGKLAVRPKPFEVKDLFGALRGMLKPLLVGRSLQLVFEEPVGIPLLHTDEGKVSQILRNLISNALKFTPKGEVRVSARAEGEYIIFTVADTGIGISEHDIDLIFKEFGQVENDLQKELRGTGLGLPLSRNLAHLLGGEIVVNSTVGIGSTFTVNIAASYNGIPPETEAAALNPELDATRTTVLIIEDNHETRFLYQNILKDSRFQMVGVGSVAEAKRFLASRVPEAIVMDLLLHGRIETEFISELRENKATTGVPIIAVSVMDEEKKCLSFGANAFLLKPINPQIFVELLHRLTKRQRKGKILLIDDDEASRYVLRELLAQTEFEVLEARSGAEGLELARLHVPDVIFLDLVMPDLSGYTVLRQLKEEAVTQTIPVVIHTSQVLAAGDKVQLKAAFEFLDKASMSHPDALENVSRLLQHAGLTDAVSVKSQNV